MNHAKKLICNSPAKLARLGNKSNVTGSPTLSRYLSTPVEVKPSCKLVIFDKDGTLTSYSAMWGPWCEVTANRLQDASGKKLEEDLLEFFNYNKETKILGKSALAHETHRTLKETVIDMLVSQHGMEETKATSLVWENWLDSFDVGGMSQQDTVKPLGDVKKIFATLKEKGIMIAVCTSDSRDSVEVALKTLGISDMIDRLVCGDDSDNTAKPAPDNVHMICEDLGVGPEEAVMIGDTHFDTIMGKKSNCGAVIGVLSGQGEIRDLEDADFIVKSIDDALPIVFNDFPANCKASGAQPSKNSPHAPNRCSSRTYSTSTSNNGLLSSLPTRNQQTRNISTSSAAEKDFTHIIVGAGTGSD